MSAPTTFEAIQLSLTIVSVVVYVWFMATIVYFRKKHPFSSSFFTLCLSLGVCDLLCIFSYWVLEKFPIFGWFYTDSLVRRFNRPIAKLKMLLNVSGANQQFAGVAIMALNRCTALVFFTKHELLWRPKFLSGIVAFQILCPLAIVFPVVLTQDVYYPVNNETGQIGIVMWAHTDVDVYCLLATFVHLWMVNIASAVFYGVTLWKMSKKAKARRLGKNRNNSSRDRNRSEKRLALVGVCLSVLLTIYGWVLIKLATSRGDPVASQFYEKAWTITNDVLSWVNPYLCLLMSPTVRDHMFKMIKCEAKAERVAPKSQPARKRHTRA